MFQNILNQLLRAVSPVIGTYFKLTNMLPILQKYKNINYLENICAILKRM